MAELLQARDNNGADLLSKTLLTHTPANLSTIFTLLQPLLAVSSQRCCQAGTYDNSSESQRYTTCTLIHSHCMSTTYPRLVLPLHTSYIHTCIAACPTAPTPCSARHTTRAPPCRSEDYIDRRISSALFAPTFPALFPARMRVCHSAIENRLGRGGEGSPECELWWC
jgi:hypothetical protein